MKKIVADIISIGDEILIGQISNTNATYISNALNSIGISVNRITSVADNKKEIISILEETGQRSDIVLITGGLGPTSDDITKPALCKFFNTKLIFDKEVYKQVEEFLSKRSGTMNPLNKDQAMVPAKAKIIQNYNGTAPCLWLEKDKTIYIAMPGVPHEMAELIKNQIIPEFKLKFKLPYIYHKTILTTGIAESKLALEIKEWESQLPDGIKLAYLPSPGVVKLRLSAIGNNNVSSKVLDEVEKVKKILGNSIFGYDNDTMEVVVGRMLTTAGKTVSTAESCTGGNIAKLLTSISGSSAYFKGSIVAYSNEIKIKLLEVPENIINKHGAVSKEVVKDMALGAIKAFCSNYSIAVSGIAGPTGGTPEKPVGTVCIAVATDNGTVITENFLFGDNRERNIVRSSVAALNMLRKMLINQ
jgi:nicotinamide-nucleotide amidase